MGLTRSWLNKKITAREGLAQYGNQLTDLLLFEKDCMVNLQIPLNEIEKTSFYDLIEVLEAKKEDKISDPLAFFKSQKG